MIQTAQLGRPQTARASLDPHRIGNHASVLSSILQPDVNLSLWRRPVDPAINKELSALQAGQLPDVRCRTSATTFHNDLSALLEQQGLDPATLDHWRADLRQLADRFFEVSGMHDVKMRIETVATDACRRFHVDRTHLRLLCTYRGPGTEWLPDIQVDREAQASGAPNDCIVRDGKPSQFEPFWVGILKGDAYPDNAGHGLVHRSPPIAGTGQTRVLFCLDC